MGQGGQVVLVNGTSYTWDLIDSQHARMEWEFKRDASTVEARSTRSVYVEVESTIWRTSGRAAYQLRGTSHKFEIHANGYEVWANFTDIETHNASLGSSQLLGRVSDWPSYFVLSGTPGNFSSVGDVRNWMQKKLPQLGQHSLGQICLASSHDSGMSEVSWITTLAGRGSVITQVKGIEEQLQVGVRYFDIRPHLFEGKWVCGHYSFIDNEHINSWQGGNGASIESIVAAVNRFTETSKELIVITLHEVRSITNRPGEKFRREDFRDLHLPEWRRLLDLLTTIRDVWTPKPSHGPLENIKLTQIPLQDFIGGSQAAVLIIANPPAEIPQYKGCFRSSSWGWDSTPWDKPESERLQSFLDAKRNNPGTPYSYSGCHTQNDDEAIRSSLGFPSYSVVQLSKGQKDKAFRDLLPACSKEVIPNAVSFDAIQSSDMAALAMVFTDLAIEEARVALSGPV